MPTFSFWKKQHDNSNLESFTSNTEGLLWLKTKAIIRKDVLHKFLSNNKIQLKSTKLKEQFPELFNLLSKSLQRSNSILNIFFKQENKLIRSKINTNKIVSELYKLQNYDWGGDYKNSLDKYLVRHYVKRFLPYKSLVRKIDTESAKAVRGYVLNSWYNHWANILIEHIFKTHRRVLPTVGQIKNVDFFISDIPIDLKVTYLPAEYIEEKRKENGLSSEISFLKKKAKALNIHYNKDNKNNDIHYEISQKLKDKGSKECLSVLNTIRKESIAILNDAQKNPKGLAKWLYEHQGEMRFGSENRLYLILVDTVNFSDSWKLKRNTALLKPAIKNFLDRLKTNSNSHKKVNFTYKDKPYSALAHVLFIIKSK